MTPGTVFAGQNATYTLAVANNGPSREESPLVTDPLPPEVNPISASSPTGTCDISGSALSCELEPLDPGDAATISVVVQVDPSQNFGAIVNNTATVGGDNADAASANNSDDAVFIVPGHILTPRTAQQSTLEGRIVAPIGAVILPSTRHSDRDTHGLVRSRRFVALIGDEHRR